MQLHCRKFRLGVEFNFWQDALPPLPTDFTAVGEAVALILGVAALIFGSPQFNPHCNPQISTRERVARQNNSSSSLDFRTVTL